MGELSSGISFSERHMAADVLMVVLGTKWGRDAASLILEIKSSFKSPEAMICCASRVVIDTLVVQHMLHPFLQARGVPFKNWSKKS